MSAETLDYEYKEQKIVGREMAKEVKQSFIEYSMSVIVSRALPDVRDGMKPGQRRILYAMYEDHLTHENPFRKSATTVGNVLGRYHPHGDAAVYGTMVRMAQPFSLRYPLVEGHGNFGNVDGDGAAAYRYTEARMARLANEMMSDIEKDVVDMRPNFDNSREEPDVLPSRFPNLLVNGSVGIAVGMATNIPPHNLGEVIDGTIHLMENPDATVDELMQYIKGPDFPTAATIYGTAGIREAYHTGRGRVMVRSRAVVEEDKRRIVVTEIPYQVNKSMLIESMAQLVRDKRIEGITEIRDESGRAGMRIVIEYRRDANGQIILNQLYKYTQLQDTCAVNMLALVKGEPKILNLKEILSNYVSFQEEVITRRTQFEYNKAQAEAHIYEGYKIAIDHIDEVISIIRASESTAVARENLKERFTLTDVQAQAIVDMTLGRLSGMERQKVEDRLAKLYATLEELGAILADETKGKVKAIIKEEMLAIKNRYGDDRRTDILEAENEIVLEDLIERHTCVITMTHAGYIKRLPADSYSAQKKGGRGVKAMTTKEEDFIEKVIISDSHAYLMFFTNLGKVYMRKAYYIPEASKTAKGSNIVNILDVVEGEKITAILPVGEFEEGKYLTMVTVNGIIKRTPLCEYENQRKGGKIAINLDEGDELLFVEVTDGSQSLILASKEGKAVRFTEDAVNVVSRTARGVRGMRLSETDRIVGVMLADPDKKVLTITENGYGKRTDFDKYEERNRGIQGVRCHGLSEKTGLLAGAVAVHEDEDVMMITNEGIIIRIAAADIQTYDRSASGVRVMRLGEGQFIANISTVAKEEEESEEEAAE